MDENVDLEVMFDQAMPSHVVMLKHTINGSLQASVALNPEPEVLAGLRPDIAFAIADAIDSRGG